MSLLLESGANPQAVTKVGCWQCFQTTICGTHWIAPDQCIDVLPFSVYPSYVTGFAKRDQIPQKSKIELAIPRYRP